jgi:hypothetical protein
MGARALYLVTGLAAALCVAALSACGGGGSFNSGQRAPWRGETERACLASGAVQMSAEIQLMEEIDGPGVCGLERPLHVSGLAGGRVWVSPPATIGCPMTLGLERWVKDSVQPAAYRYYGRPVVAIKQIASYGCRGRNGNSNGAPSEHAFGNALDIAGFRFAGGEEITVVQGWWKGSARDRAFLEAVAYGACDEFYTVLAPGSDRYHYNHIHVDFLRPNNRNGHHLCQPKIDPNVPVAEGAGEPQRSALSELIPFMGPSTRRN